MGSKITNPSTYQMIKSALESSGAGIWDWDILTGEIFYDHVWLNMVGYGPQDVKPDFSGWFSLIHPDDLPLVQEQIRELLTLEKQQYLSEHRLLTKTGEYIWVRSSGRIIEFGADGNPTRASGTHIDITQAKKAHQMIEESLRQQEVLARFSQVINYIDDFESSIQQALGIIGNYLNVSRVFIFENHEDGQTASSTFEWSPEGIPFQRNKPMTLAYDQVPAWKELLDRDQSIKARNIAQELPPEIITNMGLQQIKSMIIIPLKLNPDQRIGFLGLDQCDRERAWDQSEFEMLLICAESLSNSYKRRKSEQDLRTSQERYRGLVEAQEDLITRFDPDGKITFVNQALCRFFDQDQSFMLAQNIDSFKPIPLTSKTVDIQELLRVLDQPPHRYYGEYGFIVDNKLITFGWQITGICGPDGSVIEIQASGRDITAQKDYQTKLEAERAKAQQASEAKSLFISKVSHELRTPLNSIIGYTDLVAHSDIPAKTRHHVNSVLKSSKHLKNLIDDILDFTKIESRKVRLHMTDFDLRNVIHDLLNSFKIQLPGSVTLAFNLPSGFPAWIRLDELKIRQILINLIGNAIKFTKEGQITVDIQAINQTDNTMDLLFLVTDTGIGVPKDQLARIFQSFEQIESDAIPTTTGTGLGLPIVKAFVEMMDGSIEVKSKMGAGSRFTVRLPGVHFHQEDEETSPEYRDVNVNPDTLSPLEIKTASTPESSGFDQLLAEIEKDSVLFGQLMKISETRLSEAVASHSLNRISSLSEVLNDFSSQNNSRPLKELVDEFDRCLESYDIENLESYMHKLTELQLKFQSHRSLTKQDQDYEKAI
jgi:PAS domain S-box-containing protein